MARVRVRGGAVNGGMKQLTTYLLLIAMYRMESRQENKSREKKREWCETRGGKGKEKSREDSSEYKVRDKRWFIDKVGMRQGELKGGKVSSKRRGGADR